MQKLKQKSNANPVGAGLVPAQNKGITLIALIITIIVMLILVGVTINVALNGGLLKKAEIAKEGTQNALEEEQLMVAIVSAYNEKTGVVDKTTLQTELSKQGTWQVTGEGPYGVTSPKGNAYTVDENGKIVEGNKSKKEGNEVIAHILTKLLLEEITEEEAVQQLKQELSIEDEENVLWGGIAEYIMEASDDEVYIYCYLKKVDEVYVANVADSSILGFSYADEETYKKQYNLLRGLDVMREELENVFTDTTSAEMLEKFNNGTLDEYVLDKSDIITAIEFRYCGDSYISMNYVTIYEGENEATLLYEEHAYTIRIMYAEGNYSHVDIHSRKLKA